MKSSKFSPIEIAKILKEFEFGKSLDTIVRGYGVNKVTFYKWRQRYGGMEASELKKVKQLEEENTELALELDMAKYIIEKSSKALCQASTCARVERTLSKRH